MGIEQGFSTLIFFFIVKSIVAGQLFLSKFNWNSDFHAKISMCLFPQMSLTIKFQKSISEMKSSRLAHRFQSSQTDRFFFGESTILEILPSK